MAFPSFSRRIKSLLTVDSDTPRRSIASFRESCFFRESVNSNFSYCFETTSRPPVLSPHQFHQSTLPQTSGNGCTYSLPPDFLQDLTAPAARPLIKFFCIQRKRITIGILDRIMAANAYPNSVARAPKNCCTPTIKVGV